VLSGELNRWGAMHLICRLYQKKLKQMKKNELHKYFNNESGNKNKSQIANSNKKNHLAKGGGQAIMLKIINFLIPPRQLEINFYLCKNSKNINYEYNKNIH
jgi:hypothetical protein